MSNEKLQNISSLETSRSSSHCESIVANNGNVVSESLDKVPPVFRDVIIAIESADLEISNQDIENYARYFQEGKQPPEKLQQKVSGGTLHTHNNKKLNLTEVKKLLNGEYFSDKMKNNIQILFPFHAKYSRDQYDGSVLNIASDSVVYTDHQKQKVFKVYTRYLSPKEIKRYYEIQNICTDTHVFRLTQRKFGMNIPRTEQGVGKISLSIDTSHQFIQSGKYFSYGMQDYIEGENLNETEYRGLYLEIQRELNEWVEKEYGISRMSDFASMNMKVTHKKGNVLHVVVTDLGAKISDLVSRNEESK